MRERHTDALCDWFRVLIACGLVASLLDCSSEPSGPSIQDPAPSGEEITRNAYSLALDSTMITVAADSLSFWLTCEGDRIESIHTTYTPSRDTLPYTLYADTLFIADYVMTRDDTVLALGVDYLRTAPGPGITGHYRFSSYTGRTLSGNYTWAPGSMKDYYTFVGQSYVALFEEPPTLVVTDHELATYGSLTFGKRFLFEWCNGSAKTWLLDTLPDSALYKVATSVTRDQAILTGGVTGEVVTLSFGRTQSPWEPTALNADVLYRSSDTSHQQVMVYATGGLHCPNTPPSWYDEFLEANRRPPVAKRVH